MSPTELPDDHFGRILVIEDDAIIALDIAQTLESAGHTVLGPAASAAEALELASKDWPEVVLSDFHLPDLNGLECAAALNAIAPAPVVFLTGSGQVADNVAQVGHHAFLLKPYDDRVLLATIRGGHCAVPVGAEIA